MIHRPSYLFSDAAILATYTDSVLYVVRHDMAELPQVKKGMEPFILEDKLIGYILNRSHRGLLPTENTAMESMDTGNMVMVDMAMENTEVIRSM